VVKIGSALLVDRGTGDAAHRLAGAGRGCRADQGARGTDVILVSSGSIALGRGFWAWGRGAVAGQAQAAAAVGQIRLARAYEEALAPHGITTAQILLTLDDSGTGGAT
jgi:glutamate 5-kinase